MSDYHLSPLHVGMPSKNDLTRAQLCMAEANEAEAGVQVEAHRAQAEAEAEDASEIKAEPEPEAVLQGSSADTAAIHDDETTALATKVGAQAERCKWIPLRLSSVERELLSFLEGALHVSEYTDNVDVMSRYNLASRIIGQMEDFCAMHSGLVVCKNFKKGSRVIGGGFSDNGGVFQLTFEAGRRYKIMSPQKMPENFLTKDTIHAPLMLHNLDHRRGA